MRRTWPSPQNPPMVLGYRTIQHPERWSRSGEFTDFGPVICYYSGDEKKRHRLHDRVKGVVSLINFPVGVITVPIMPEFAS
jgi:hypothetical protein